MATAKGLSASELALLAKYDTPTICNVIELFDVRPRNTGYMGDAIRCRFPQMPPMVGYAATATYRTVAKPPKTCDIPELVATFDNIPGPPVVVLQDVDEPTIAASFGDMMCTAFKAFGSVGLVTSGGGRDLDQVEEISYPVFTGSIICAHGYCCIPTVGDPIHVGGVWITPGDLLHGDRNGVTTIPNEIASEVAHVAEEYVAAERAVLDYFASTPEPTLAGYRAAIAECAKSIEALVSRIRKGA